MGKVGKLFKFCVMFLLMIGFFFYFDMVVLAGASAVRFLVGGNSILYAVSIRGNEFFGLSVCGRFFWVW